MSREPVVGRSEDEPVRSKGGTELDRAEQFALDDPAVAEGRRAPFARGNRMAMTHGLRSVRVTERTQELADWLRLLAQDLGVYRPSFDALFDLAGIAFEKVERYDAWSSEFTDAGDFERATAAEQAARAWWNRALRSLSEAGVTASSFARAKRDAAIGESAWRTLERHLDTTYGAETGEGAAT